MARPTMYELPRRRRMVFYVDEYLEKELRDLATETGRSMADYLYQVIRMHADVVLDRVQRDAPGPTS